MGRILKFLLIGFMGFLCKSGISQIMSENKTVVESQPEFIFNNGLFLDGVIGLSIIQQKYDYNNFHTYYENGEEIVEKPAFITLYQNCIHFKMGYNWFLGNKPKWKPGIQLTFLNLGVITDFRQLFGTRTSAGIGHIGFSNVFKLNHHMGIESNVKAGISVLDPVDLISHYSPAGAINYGVDIKYIYKILSIGIDYSRFQANFNSDRYTAIDNIALIIGAKF